MPAAGELQLHYGSAPSRLDRVTAAGVSWQCAPSDFLIEVPDAGRIRVECGDRITLDPIAISLRAQLEKLAYSTPLAALHFQRGVPAFHAAAAIGPQGAALIAGDSGAGKSTLLAALLQRGWRMLADELAAISLDENHRPIVHATAADLVLWPDVAQRLAVESPAELAQQKFVADPQALSAIWWLSVGKDDEVKVVDITGTAGFGALTTLLYNTRIAEALLDRASFMRHATAIMQAVPIRRLQRPRGKWSVEALADVVSSR